MKKPVVALVLTAQSDTHRTYTAFSRTGEKMGSWTAYSSGHGAHLCHEACAKKFTISTAQWAQDMAYNFRPVEERSPSPEEADDSGTRRRNPAGYDFQEDAPDYGSFAAAAAR